MAENYADSQLPESQDVSFHYNFSGDDDRRLLSAEDYEHADAVDEDYDEDEYYASLPSNSQADELKTLSGSSSLRENARRKNKDRQKRSPVLSIGSYDTENDSAFDDYTKLMVLDLIRQGSLCSVDSLLHAGQTANIYRATCLQYMSAYEKAVLVLKIYKSPKPNATTPINLRGDSHAAKKQRHLLLRKSAKREFENLQRATRAGMAPRPLFVHEHIIAMEFAGTNRGEIAPLLRVAKIYGHYPLSRIFMHVMSTLRFLYHWENLVHGRLGDDNILLRNSTVCFLDFSSAVDRSAPDHIEALSRDLESVRAIFASRGLREDDEKWALWPLDTMKKYVTLTSYRDVHQLLQTCTLGWRYPRCR